MKPAFFGLRDNSFSKNPILVIDRDGLIGEPLSLKLSKEFLVVFVSRRSLYLEIENQNIVHIPFSKKVPSIPDNKYSHIIFIDEEGSDSEIVPKIIEKTKDVNADFIFAQKLFLQNKFEINRILQMHHSAKVVLFGDIFSKELILREKDSGSTINGFIYQAQKFGRIQVSREGLREAYPVFIEDVVDGLIDIVFKMHKPDSLFYIFPKYPPTEISLAHMIQKKNPEITIDFTRRGPNVKNISFPSGGKYLLEDKYPLAKKIRGVDIKKKVKSQNEGENRITKKLKPFSFFIIWVLIFLLFSPFIFTLLFSFLGKNTFYYAKGEMEKGNFAGAKSSLHLSQTFFYLGKQTYSIFYLQAKTVGQENNLGRFFENIDAGYKMSNELSQAVDSIDYFSKILNGKSNNPIDDLAKGESYLGNAIVILNKLKAEGKIPSPILQNLEAISPLIKLLSNTSDIMPSIFGMDGPKTFLFLFQDNTELRPGGGVIDSYGILKLNMGKIMQFTINDVYDADSQLRGHVEPPFALRRYLPEQHWHMKDSNFDVDFVKSASSSSNFLFVETGRKVDGVIAIDTSFVKNILHAIGQVYVADYKAILRGLVGKRMSYFLIAQAISDALSQKHLMFAFSNNSQNIFTVNGWSSSLWDGRKDSKESFNDFIGISEANLGLNKVNDFIKRQVLQKVTIGNGENILEELTINYKNESTSWPGGDYKNYLRIILPKDAKLSKILINNKSQEIVDAVVDPLIYEAKKFKAPTGLEVEKSIESGKTIYGFLINIPAGELVKIKIQYAVPRKNTFDSNNFSYNLKIFKQPGIDVLPYSLDLYYPDNLNVVNAGEFKKEDNSLSYSENITEDKELTASFAGK